MAGLGQAACHEGDHGPQDHGFVAGGQALVVADGAAVLADPGERPLYHPPPGQYSNACGLRLGTICRVIFMAAAQVLSLPVNGVGPDQADAAAGAVQVPQQRPGRVAVLDGRGGVITTASSRPIASTAMCRFLPFTFFALSQPRLALGTVSAARTDWESITAAVGSRGPEVPGKFPTDIPDLQC